MGYIDADTHVLETNQAWEYLDPSERHLRPECLVTDDEASTKVWLIDGFKHPYGRTSRSSEVTLVERSARELSDIPLRVKWMDQLGIDYQVIYPSLFIPVQIKRPEVQAALARAYNRWMADVHAESKGRLKWAIVPSLGSMERTLEDLEFGRKNGGVAVFMRAAEHDRLLIDPYFDPLYARANDLNLAIGIHVGAAFPRIQNTLNGHVIFMAVPNVGAFHNILMSDVPDRFPNLRFGFLESTATWIPWALEEAHRGGLAGVRSRVDVSGQLMADRRLFVACTIDDDLPYLLKFSGADTLVLGTDFGHSDRGTDIEAHALLMERTDVDLEVRRKIVDDNGRRLYGLAA